MMLLCPLNSRWRVLLTKHVSRSHIVHWSDQESNFCQVADAQSPVQAVHETLVVVFYTVVLVLEVAQGVLNGAATWWHLEILTMIYITNKNHHQHSTWFSHTICGGSSQSILQPPRRPLDPGSRQPASRKQQVSTLGLERRECKHPPAVIINHIWKIPYYAGAHEHKINCEYTRRWRHIQHVFNTSNIFTVLPSKKFRCNGNFISIEKMFAWQKRTTFSCLPQIHKFHYSNFKLEISN
jgi:hypothetical protein